MRNDIGRPISLKTINKYKNWTLGRGKELQLSNPSFLDRVERSLLPLRNVKKFS